MSSLFKFVSLWKNDGINAGTGGVSCSPFKILVDRSMVLFKTRGTCIVNDRVSEVVLSTRR